MSNVKTIVKRLRTKAGSWKALGDAVGVQSHQPRDWARRGVIPGQFWLGLVTAGAEFGDPVSLDEIATAHAARVSDEEAA